NYYCRQLFVQTAIPACTIPARYGPAALGPLIRASDGPSPRSDAPSPTVRFFSAAH
ncbi:hypothetical protein KXX65_003779, partial [Aspergillus fumigatus]